MHVSEVAQALRESKRPLFHIGNGVRGCIDEFLALAERLQIPFVTARNGNDLVASDHPLFIGRPGTFAQRGANFAVQTCDLYIAIGTRLSLAQTGYNAKDYARNAVIIQVDIDQAELDKETLRKPARICCDAADFIRALMSDSIPVSDALWLARCKEWQQRYPVVLPEYLQQKGSVNSYHFIDVLSDLAAPDDIIVTDMGMAFQCTHQAWKVKKGQRLLTNCSLAPMGWGLPAAIGASFATGRRVLCIVGDGGLMMNLQELATVAHHNLNIKIFVFNNGGYATIKQTQEFGFEGRLMGVDALTGLSFPDFREVAKAHKLRWTYLTDHHSLVMLAGILASDSPILCDVNLLPNQPQAPRFVNRRVDGKIVSSKLEDMWPFLDPKVIEEEMKI